MENFKNDLYPIPNLFEPGFDHDAFNALGVMGLIEAFNAGTKTIYIIRENLAVIAGSTPHEALRLQGWKFRIITGSEPLL